jgi:hypothetical protein
MATRRCAWHPALGPNSEMALMILDELLDLSTLANHHSR